MRKDDKHFNVYIGKDNKKVWDAIEYAKSKGLNPSSYLCEKIIEGYHRDISNADPFSPPPDEAMQERPEKYHILFDLVSLSQEYDDAGVDGLEMSYILPRLFSQIKITKEQMILLVVFVVKLYFSIIGTTELKDMFISQSNRLLQSKRDTQSKFKVDQFKELLGESILDDWDRHIREEELRKKYEQDEKNKEAAQLYKQKLDVEKRQWELENPGKPYWQKGMTDEMIETSLKIESGEWVVVDDDLEEEDESGSTFI